MQEKIGVSLFNKRCYWLISSMSSMALMLLAMSYAQVLWNGKYSFIMDDLYEQVTGFSRLFYSKLLDGSTMYYSFKAGLGMNTSLLFAFYSFSPFNIIYALLGVESINTSSIIVFILKIGFSAALFQLYCRYNLNECGVLSIFGSICYALMSYAVYISRMNPLYDAVYMLPLIFILIKCSIKKNTFFFLSIAYSYLFITNFYGGYIVGSTSFIYCMVLIFAETWDARQRVKVFLRYVFAVFVALLISGFLIAPTLYEALNQNVIENVDSFTVVPLWEQIVYLFPLHSAEMYHTFPSYYCGIPVLFMIPAFFFNIEISKKSKLISGLVIIACILSMTIKPLYLLGHMFNDPTGYTCRYIYVFSFFFISMFVKAIQHHKGIDYMKVLLADIVLVVVYVLTSVIYLITANLWSDQGIVEIILVVVFAVIWLILFSYIKKWEEAQFDGKKFLAIAFFVLCVELGLHNYTMLDGIVYPSADNVENYISRTYELTTKLGEYDTENHRVQYNLSNNTNQGALFDYMGGALFASSSNQELKDFLKSIGVFCNEFMITESGNTDLTRLLLDEKYIINGTISSDGVGREDIVLNTNTAGMGFMISDKAYEYTRDNNVFDNQNSIYQYLNQSDVAPNTMFVGGINFEPHNISISSSDEGIVLKRTSMDEDGYVAVKVPHEDGKKAYIWINTGYERASFESPLLLTNDTENNYAYIDSYLTTSHIVKMSRDDDDYFCAYIYFGKDAISEITLYELYIAYSDMEKIASISDELSEKSMDIAEFEDGYIKGLVEAGDGEMLFMSVPYEKGWEAYVDGLKADIVPLFENSFIGVPLAAGQHEVELKFVAPYTGVGRLMSMIGVLLLSAMIVFDVIYLKKRGRK